MVVNFSLDDEDFYVPLGGCVRARVQVSMLCRTVIHPDAMKNSPQEPSAALAAVKRDQIACNIVYQSYVDFGGWAPAAATRAVAKKEYPKFVKKFSLFVKNQTKDKPIMF
jgi:collagen type IV alpha-3-binding protein